MRRSGIPALALLLASTFAAAQTPAQTPAPSLQPLPQSADRPLDPAYTIKANTQLVVLDVVVKDKKGKQIHGLKASDFTVTESGKPQQVQSFEEHSALTAQQAAAIPPRPQLPPGEFTNFVATPQTGALNIILYDTTNTAVKDQMFMHAQLIDYLKHARPDSRTAIFALGTHIVQVAGFTSDPQTLLDALTRKRNPQNSLFVDDTTGGLTASQSSTIAGSAITAAAGSFPTGIAQLEGPETAYQSDQRAYITLDGLNTLGRYLVTLPGRKNLIWFAGDFPTQFFPSENNYDGPYPTTAFLDDEFRDTVNLLSRAQVAVYPIDAQGLRTDQDNSASRANSSYASGSRGMGRGGTPESAGHRAEFSNRSSENMAASQIARDTGGTAFYNHNDLARMVDDAIADGANYYTLSYVPSDSKVKGDGFRSIHVNVAGGPYDLSYRRGYFTDKRSQTREVAMAANAPSPASSLTQAMRPGAPQPSQVLIRLKVFPSSTPDQTTVAKRNDANPDAKIAHPPFRDYEIDAAASVSTFRFERNPDNTYSTTVDFVTFVYDVNGTLINSQSDSAKVSYTKEKLTEALRTGLHLSHVVSVPAKGEYFLRVAVHDTTSGHIGAVELPVAAVAGLPIGGTPAAAPAKQ